MELILSFFQGRIVGGQINTNREKALVNQCFYTLIYKGFFIGFCEKSRKINIRAPPCGILKKKYKIHQNFDKENHNGKQKR